MTKPDTQALLALCERIIIYGAYKSERGDFCTVAVELKSRLEAELQAEDVTIPVTLIEEIWAQYGIDINAPPNVLRMANAIARYRILAAGSVGRVTKEQVMSPQVIEAVRIALVAEIGGRAPRAANESSLDYTRRVATTAVTTLLEQMALLTGAREA